MKRDIGIGIVGGGMICQVAHLPFYLRDGRCEVRAVAESRPSLVSVLSAQLQNARVVPDHRELLDAPDIDAVVIVAPRGANAALAHEALVAGKHVLVEKPMAHSVVQGRRLADAAAAGKLVCAIGYMKRYDAGVAEAKRLFSELRRTNRFGRLLLARFYDYSRSYAMAPPPHRRPAESRTTRFAEWPLWPEWLPDDRRDAYAWFMNSGSHDVNLMNYFFDAPLEPVAAACPAGAAFVADLRDGDVPVRLEVTRTSAGQWLEGVEFLFEDGRLAVDIPSPMATDCTGRVVVQATGDSIPVPGSTGASEWCFAAQARGFIDSLTGAEPPRTSAADGLHDLELCEALWRRAVATA